MSWTESVALRRRWTDLPLRVKGLVVVAIPVIPLVLMGALVYVTQRQADEAERMVAHTLQVKAALDRTHTLLVEAELGARGYLVSRNSEPLAAYRASVAALPGTVRGLLALLRDNPEQIERLKGLSSVARSRPLTSIIAYVESTAPGAPMPLDLLARSRAAMAVLRATLGDMQRAEDVLLEAQSARARAARRRALLATGGSVVLGLVGGLIAALLFTSGIGRRIGAVTANARRLSTGEPLVPMAPARDEVGALAASLSVTAELLAQRSTELQRRMTALKAVNEELEAFSYSVSHDLRAPLRHIAGFATLLQKRAGDKLDGEAARQLRTILDSAASMGRMVDDLLAFSRMGRAEMLEQRVNLDDLVREVVKSAGQDAAGRRINWTTHPLPSVPGDPAMLRLAFANLVSNAVKYTTTRDVAEIEIGARPGINGDRVVYVKDNGVGFDMAYVEKLFGVFQRLHTSEEFEGNGIGLASVRRIVQRHGGRTWAEGAVGTGATFFVALPAGGSPAH